MVQPPIAHGHEVVDLISDDEADDFSDDGFSFHDAHSVGEQHGDEEFLNLNELYQHEDYDIENPDIIDLTAIPDSDNSPSDHIPTVPTDATQLITEALCLQLVLDVFPDVSTDHVLTKIRESTTDLTRTKEHSERIVNELLEGDYPKEVDVASKKRRREDTEEASEYENEERDIGALGRLDVIELLKDEFLQIPVRHITNTVKTHGTLYKSYIILEEQLRNYRQVSHTFNKPPRPRTKRGIELTLIEAGSRLPKELRAAKRKVESEATKRRKLDETKAAEEANFQQARKDNTMGECQCCFTEYPLNRMISCSGKDKHSFCMDCPKQYIETEMGQSRCRPECFASTKCKGTFSRAQLQQVLDVKTFERLEHMQQQQEIAAAGLDFLSECPFCDFKAECPPVDVDKEFRCQNTKCGKTSCRLCNKETHIPLSCEEAKKDGQLSLRHVVEEAMSAALIRKCNNCQRPFIKDYGCNKMSCTHCGNKQCYLCSKDVNNYDHFGDPNRGRCALHDNVEDTHEQAVKKAADDAMAQVRAENPGVSDADLMIQVSDRVKQAEAARKGQAAERLNEFPYHMLGDQLAHRPGFLPPPPERPQMMQHDGLAAAAGPPGVAAPMYFFVPHHPQGLPQQAAPIAPPHPPLRAHRHYHDVFDPLAPLDLRAQAAQDRFQRQLREAHQVDRLARRDLDAAEREVRRARMQRDLEEQVARQRQAAVAGHEAHLRAMNERYLRHQERALRIAPLPAPPAFGNNGLLAGGGRLAAVGGAGPGGGLAFGGRDANRAVRRLDVGEHPVDFGVNFGPPWRDVPRK